MLLPQPMAFPEKQYSLQPDMVFGWVPKMKSLSIKLTFASNLNDEIIATSNIIYVGFRPNDSIQLHRQFKLRDQKQLFEKPVAFFGMLTQDVLHFNSAFEGGNLDAVIKKQLNEYELLMRVDSNTRGHLSWYNFKVTAQESLSVKLNIINFTKSKTLYTSGMLPYLKIGAGDWMQGGTNVKFEEKAIKYCEHTRKYYTLSFELELELNVEVQVAYCPPYSYSDMVGDIQRLNFFPWFSYGKLCQDLSGLDVPLLTIENEGFKKVVLIQARVHPGESNGSWMMHGLLDYVIESEELRKNCLIKIIPMANPDGVVVGNYRTGLAGRDLNREFLETDEVLFPSVHKTKELVRNLINNYGKLFAFIDLHGHSLKKNVFLYGPEFPVYDTNYMKSRMLAKMLAERTAMFRYYGCMFRVSEHKRSTARGVFSEEDDLWNCFTLESSNYGFFDEQSQSTIKFTPKHWKQMGRILGQSLNELVIQTLLNEENDKQRKQKGASQIRMLRHQETTKMKNTQRNKQINARGVSAAVQKSPQEDKSESGSDNDSSADDYDLEELKQFKNQILQQKRLLSGETNNNKRMRKPKKKKVNLFKSSIKDKNEVHKQQQRMSFSLNNNNNPAQQISQLIHRQSGRQQEVKICWSQSPKHKKPQQQSITPYLMIQTSQLPSSLVHQQHSSEQLSRPLTALLQQNLPFQKQETQLNQPRILSLPLPTTTITIITRQSQAVISHKQELLIFQQCSTYPPIQRDQQTPNQTKPLLSFQIQLQQKQLPQFKAQQSFYSLRQLVDSMKKETNHPNVQQ